MTAGSSSPESTAAALESSTESATALSSTTEPLLHFSREEFAARRARALALAAERGMTELLLFRQESMHYLTGYDSFGWAFFQCMLLTGDGRTILLTRAPDLRQAQLTSVVDDVRIWTDGADANPAALAAELAGKNGGKLGVEWDAPGLPHSRALALAAALAGRRETTDASGLVAELRAVKSPAELVHVRRAAALADAALAAAARATAPGAFEGDILAEMQGAVFRGGGEYAGNEFILGSGARALLCRSFAGKRRLAARDQLTLEFAGSYARYHAALMRTFATGAATARHREMHAACVEALHGAAAELRPGNPLGLAFDAHARILDAAGMRAHRLNACGYSLGAVFGPSWMDWPMLYHGNPVAARAGMVIFVHIILMDSETQTAMTLGQTYLVGEHGAESLSRAGLELTVKE